MIWSLVTKEEMDGFGTSPVFRFYREALGKDNIKLAVVDENDTLEFVKENDIVLLRTASKSLIETINKKNLLSTAEDFQSYQITSDKRDLASRLQSMGVNVPRQYQFGEVENGKKYFVKPRFGSDSKGISSLSICRSIDDVQKQVLFIREELKQEAIIEEFIDGVDCTIACARNRSYFDHAAIDIECEETDGIQTRDCKVGFKEYCSPIYGDTLFEMNKIAQKIFIQLGLKHHARIDFRRDKDGKLYVIDINLLAGLGPLDHFAKSFCLSNRCSYWDVMNKVINSATRKL